MCCLQELSWYKLNISTQGLHNTVLALGRNDQFLLLYIFSFKGEVPSSGDSLYSPLNSQKISQDSYSIAFLWPLFLLRFVLYKSGTCPDYSAFQGFEITPSPSLLLSMSFKQLFHFQRASWLELGGEAVQISAVACVEPTLCKEIGGQNLMQLCFKNSCSLTVDQSAS